MSNGTSTMVKDLIAIAAVGAFAVMFYVAWPYVLTMVGW